MINIIFFALFFCAEQVDGLEAHNIVQIVCGSHHTLALNEWGQVFAWGSNSHGQLGLNIPDQINQSPKMIKSLATKQVIQIACGQNHSMALTNGIHILYLCAFIYVVFNI